MREPLSAGRVTGTDSRAFLFPTVDCRGTQSYQYNMIVKNNAGFFCHDNTRRFYLFISILLIVSLVERLYVALGIRASSFNYNDWSYSEFMINFQGGFVRRGLLGEILYHLCRYTGLEPAAFILPVCISAYLFVVYFFLKKFRSRNYCWFLILSPLFCGYVGDIIRKDYMLYCLLILIMLLLANGKMGNAKISAVVIISSLGLFMHEAFVFWGLPIVALLLFNGNLKSKQGISFSLVIIGVFLFLSVYHGSMQHVSSIVVSWQELLGENAMHIEKNNSIGAIGWDTLAAIRGHIRLNFSGMLGWVTFFIRPLGFLITYYFVVNFLWVFRERNSFNKDDRTNLSVLFLFSIVCMLPMFLFLSCDYARLYQYAVVSAFTAFLLFPRWRLSKLLPKKIYELVAVINNKIDQVIVPTKGIMILILLLFAVPPCYFDVYGAIKQSVYASFFNGVIMFAKSLIGAIV